MRITALVRSPVLRSSAACLLAGGVVALAGAGPAQAAAITNRRLAGMDSLVGCLSATRCVVAGQSASGHGEIIPVEGGVPGRGTVVRSTLQFDAISCPSRAGCWALGVTNDNAKPVLVLVSAAGRVARVVTLSPRGAPTLTAISCVSLTDCEVAGGAGSGGPPFPIEVGSWNGSRLRVQTVATPANSTQTLIAQISCHGSLCLAVGYAEYGSEVELGAVLSISRGHPGKAHTTPQSQLVSVSCVSDSTCYAVGADTDGAGVLVTIRNGKVSAPRATAADPAGIACVGSRCAVAGQVTSGSGLIGELVPVLSGRVAGPAVGEPVVLGYSDITSRGSLGGFAAIGSAQGANASELTIGPSLSG
jgi:hypothetical protein